MIEIISHSGGHDFTVVRGGKKVCSLRKKGWFQGPAKGVVNDDVIQFKPAGIFKTKYNIFKNERLCGYIKLHWSGGGVISLERADGLEADLFYLKAKNWLGIAYVLSNQTGEPIMKLTGKFHLATMNYKFQIEEGEHDYLDQEIDELLLYTVYAKKLHLNNQGYM